ncbi:MAG: antibiotic biosynthesis monooxygenase [Alteromonadaceae bacterium]|uniref:antibiotic biosynthesis monooxygenase family protein n=1 Tax=Paraglaciecola chathamensis TaxID=368405 RepID=UPI000C600B26|nr:antibiotic biosynthesis monooxygenase family protein [Paraglaciecola agarilytica]MBN27815.1 antibiotic biosynthesis monooxygenase [Alteromonadaceae bacterium]|tara:strand:- start:23246 stop:23554 length:309 start_codon:yes stop_codon:yes gene_type:complete
MIYEVADIEIKPGHQAAFEGAVAKASAYFQQAKGCRSFALDKVIENDLNYQLVVGWDSVDDHMNRFRASDGFAKWRELASPHFSGAPKVCHVNRVICGFGDE